MSEDYDYRLEDPSAERIDSIAATKILVAKTGVSENLFLTKKKLKFLKAYLNVPKKLMLLLKASKKVLNLI
ncbi:MAG: hypothetical protein ACTSSH_14505 [Candidatus Heimdallarchaeota archaeon]